MNYLKVDYRPTVIEFDVANNSNVVPDNLGIYPSAQEASEFIAKNLTGINHKLTVSRFMDHFEKSELRKEYQEILEDKMPMVERDLMKATGAHEEAKRKLTEAKEYVNATTNEAKALAVEVKRGVKDVCLDDMYTWRVPFDGRYYFYTYMDGMIKLCKIADIPEYEKMDLYNAMNRNDQFFNDNFPGVDHATSKLREMVKSGEVTFSMNSIGVESE